MDLCIGKKKTFDFFNQDCQDLAKALLGQVLVRNVNGKRLSGIVSETECYLGSQDVASHSYGGKRTARNEPMYMIPGTAYVYFIYGMYHCFNISSKEEGSCVLIRSLEPLEGIETMEANLKKGRKDPTKKLKITKLCNGPSKLCRCLNITKDSCNKLDMSTSDSFWVEDGSRVRYEDIVSCKRIGIDSAGPEWANKPLRFYCKGNPFVSVRDEKAE